MSLETFLQQRWPMPTSVPRTDEEIDDLANKLESRRLFSEGYNAAKAEEKIDFVNPEWGSREEVENKVRELRSEGKRLEALKYFRSSPYSVGGLKDDKDYCETLSQ